MFMAQTNTIHQQPIMIATPLVKGGGVYATPDTIRRGSGAEQRFANMCSKRRLGVYPATPFENRVMHFDYIVVLRDGLDTRQRVEVKAIKSRRRGETPDPSVIFVELKNVSGGPGWVYGKSDIVAFEQPSGFLMVQTRALKHLAESMVSTCKHANRSGIHHTLYKRRERDDLMLVLSRDDVTKLDGTFVISD